MTNIAADPTYPPEIKPFLYAYDEYQTYDLVYVEISRTGAIWTTWEIQVPLGFVFQSSALFERFTPWEYPWADRWSLKFRDFLFPFTGSLSQGTTAFLRYPFASQYQTTQSITLTIPKGQVGEEVILTWLQRDDGMPGFRGAEAEFMKSYKKIFLRETAYTLSIPIGILLRCSMVVSGTNGQAVQNIEDQIRSKGKGYLYSGLNAFFQQISAVIQSAHPDRRKQRVITTFNIQSIRNVGKSYILPGIFEYDRFGVPIVRQWSIAYFEDPFIEENTISSSHEDIECPNWYRGCGIFFANNNRWGNAPNPPPDKLSANPYYAIADIGFGEEVLMGFLRSGEAAWEPKLTPELVGNGYPPENWVVSRATQKASVDIFQYRPDLHSKPGAGMVAQWICTLRYKPFGVTQDDTTPEFTYRTDAVIKRWVPNSSGSSLLVDVIPKQTQTITAWKYWVKKATGEVFLRDQDVYGWSLPNTELNFTDVKQYQLVKADVAPPINAQNQVSGATAPTWYSSAEAVPQPGEIGGADLAAICYAFYLARSSNGD